VGVGHLGQHHARNYTEIEGCELVGVVDTDAKTASRIAHQHRTHHYSSHRDLLGKVDAVSIVTPTVAHHAVARDFLDAGVHVMVEKPITVTVEEARDLIDVASAKGLILQVGHIERFNAASSNFRKY